jgi:hypothetical protein
MILIPNGENIKLPDLRDQETLSSIIILFRIILAIRVIQSSVQPINSIQHTSQGGQNYLEAWGQRNGRCIIIVVPLLGSL